MNLKDYIYEMVQVFKGRNKDELVKKTILSICIVLVIGYIIGNAFEKIAFNNAGHPTLYYGFTGFGSLLTLIASVFAVGMYWLSDKNKRND